MILEFKEEDSEGEKKSRGEARRGEWEVIRKQVRGLQYTSNVGEWYYYNYKHRFKTTVIMIIKL